MEKITWKMYVPDEFPCMICGKNRAEWKGQFRHRGTTVNLCLCNVCANLPEIILMEKIFGITKMKTLAINKALDRLCEFSSGFAAACRDTLKEAKEIEEK